MAVVPQWGVKVKKVKIKVIKTTCFHDLAMSYGHGEDYHACPIFKEGQEFITTGPFGNDIPKDFCHMAWQALFMPVNVLIGGGKVLGFDEIHIACCNDGLRPVVFELTRIEEEE